MEELARFKKDYEKALEEGNATRLDEILDSLASIPITFAMLKSTGMVGVLKKTKHCNNEEIKKNMKLIKKSMDLMAKWKKEVTDLLRKESSEKKDTSPKTETSTNSSPSTPAPEEIPSEVVVVEKKSPKAVQTISETLTSQQIDSIINCSSILPLRSRFRKLLYEDFQEKVGSLGLSVSSLVKAIERVENALNTTYNMKGEVSGEYRQRFRDLRYNLGKNTLLLKQVIAGDIQAERFVKMSTEEMMTEEAKKEEEKIKGELFEASQMNWMEINHMEMLGGGQKCKRCGSDKTSYTQKQTRSADEPMTIFHVCYACHLRWRE